ncbi:MAG TPA: cyclase family protein [Sphingomicrobium sp.]|nr:cyclase family protein [Sphingomicrobium sp.]
MSRLVDLSHVIAEGMTTYRGFPGPQLCDFWTREESAAFYEDGSSFHIGRIAMIANTGTYLDAPFHRYAEGADVAGLELGQVAALEGLVVRQPWEDGLAVGVERFEGLDVAGKAVLVHTGWDRHWRTDAYFDGHPFLTAEAAEWLADRKPALVGIDSYNIDDTRTKRRPVHSTLLGAGVLICEHMTNLGALPDDGFAFTAAPPKIEGMGTFPVRAFASLS